MRFIGRNDELKQLQEVFEEPTGQLVVLYGRRRVGKTELLKVFCHGHHCLFYSAQRIVDRVQLDAFGAELQAFCNGTGLTLSDQDQIRFADWSTAFQYFCRNAMADSTTEHAQTSGDNRKAILVIDEFPYIAQENPAVCTALQHVCDHMLKASNVMIILCGSAVSFMESAALGEKNPLYGRASVVRQLQPLSYREAGEFFPSYSSNDKFLAYSILGGIPYYLESFSDSRPLSQNVIRRILRDGAFLHEEPQVVLQQELRDISQYQTILQSIACGATTLTEIAQKSIIDRTSVPKYLKTLSELRLVQRELSYPVGRSDGGNAQRGIYRLQDNYLRFWYRFLGVTGRKAAYSVEPQILWEEFIEPNLPEFVSPVFEDICRQFLLTSRAREILGWSVTSIGRWWHKDQEIDIVAMNGLRNKILAGECKYTEAPVGMKVLTALEEKIAKQKWAQEAEVKLALFARTGFTKELLAHASKDSRVILLTLDELYL